jgi:hypothetical protein
MPDDPSPDGQLPDGPFPQIEIVPKVETRPKIDEAAVEDAARREVAASRLTACLVAAMVVVANIEVFWLLLTDRAATSPILMTLFGLCTIVGVGLVWLYWSTRDRIYAEALGAERRRAEKDSWGCNSWSGASGASVISVVGIGIALMRGCRLGAQMGGGNADQRSIFVIGLAAIGFALIWVCCQSAGFVRSASVAQIFGSLVCCVYGLTSTTVTQPAPAAAPQVAAKLPFPAGGITEAEWKQLQDPAAPPAMVLVRNMPKDRKARQGIVAQLMRIGPWDGTYDLADGDFQMVLKGADLRGFAKEVIFSNRIAVDERLRLITIVCDEEPSR